MELSQVFLCYVYAKKSYLWDCIVKVFHILSIKRDVQRKNVVNNVDMSSLKGHHDKMSRTKTRTHISTNNTTFYFIFMISKMIYPRNVELPSCTVNDFH